MNKLTRCAIVIGLYFLAATLPLRAEDAAQAKEEAIEKLLGEIKSKRAG